MALRTGFWGRLVIAAISPTGVALALAASLGVAALGPATAQTFDQALSQAISGGGLSLGGTNCGVSSSLSQPLQDLVGCSPSPGPGTATTAGLATVHTRPGAAEDEQAVQRRLEEKRGEQRRGGAPGASPDLPRGLGFFTSFDYERFDKDLTTFEPAYDSNTYGITLGADYTFARWLVTGLGFNYSRVYGEFDLGGDFSTDSYGGLVYGSVRPIANLFVDLVAGYWRKDFSVDRLVTANFLGGTTATDTVRGDAYGNEFKTGLLAGYDFVFRNFTVGPRAGLNYSHLSVDSFEERGSGITGQELAYASQNQESLTARFGVYGSAAFSTGIGVFIPQVGFNYVHEYLDDQRTIRFHFVGDASQQQFRFQTDPPDRDYFHVGAGLLVALPGGFYPFVNYRALVGYEDESSHLVTVGLRVAF